MKFHHAILEIGFEVSPPNHCVYICNENDKLTILSLYVNDILLTSNCPNMKKNTKPFLSSKFEMKDIMAANLCLRNKNFYMDKRKPLNTPVSKG